MFGIFPQVVRGGCVQNCGLASSASATGRVLTSEIQGVYSLGTTNTEFSISQLDAPSTTLPHLMTSRRSMWSHAPGCLLLATFPLRVSPWNAGSFRCVFTPTSPYVPVVDYCYKAALESSLCFTVGRPAHISAQIKHTTVTTVHYL